MKTMANGERMLTLVLEQFARDCAFDSYNERLNNRVREVDRKGLETGVWDGVERKRISDARHEEYSRHKELEAECWREFELLKSETLPDEVTDAQFEQMVELIEAGKAMAIKRRDEALESWERCARGGPPIF